jgi:hypothetical protein
MAWEGEAMSQQSMRKAARLAASDTYRSRRSRLGIETVPSRAKIIMLSRGTPKGYWSLSACPQVPRGDCETPFFQNDADVRATNTWPISLFRGVIRNRPTEGADLGTGWEVY